MDRLFTKKDTSKEKKEGKFYCPHCGSYEEYKHIVVSRTCSLLGIDLPCGNRGEYIECTKCHASYKKDVLKNDKSYHSEKFYPLYRIPVQISMVKVMLADGIIDDRERNTIKTIYEKMTYLKLSDTEIDKDIESVKNNSFSIKKYLKKRRHMLNDYSKELIIKSAFLVVAADKVVHEKEQEDLITITKALGYSAKDFEKIIAKMH